MRKVYSLILFFLITLTLSGCVDEEVIYNLGDKVTIDGINYELVSIDELGVRSATNNFNEDGTFKEIDESKLYRKNDDRVGFLHQFYYYDMINYDNYPVLTVENIQNDYRNMRLKDEYPLEGEPGGVFNNLDHFPVDDQRLVANFNDFYPSEAFYVDENGLAQNYKYYFSVTPYIDAIAKVVSDNVFVVRGYDKGNVKEEVTIPRQIGEYDVAAIAYKALENAPMKSLTIEAGALMLYYPYSISNCPNLKKLSMENPMLMPAALSHMALDELIISSNDCEPKVGYFENSSFYAMDASFYDLYVESLKLIPLSSVNPRTYCAIHQSNFEEFAGSGVGTSFNLIFTDCEIYENNISFEGGSRFGYNFATINKKFIYNNIPIGVNYDNDTLDSVGTILDKIPKSFYQVINYPLTSTYFPLIKDGVCYSKYMDMMLSLGKKTNTNQTIIFDSNFNSQDDTITYYVEDNFIKAKLHNYKYYVKKDNYILDESKDVVLTLLEINPNNTYIVSDGTILYAHS